MYRYLCSILIAFFFILLFSVNTLTHLQNQYVRLAYAFTEGNLSISENVDDRDFGYYNGRYYWIPGSFPAIILAPFVLILGTGFKESYLTFAFSILNFWLIYQISKKLKLSPQKSVLLAIFIIFGSVYTPLATIGYSVYIAQITTFSFLLTALYLHIIPEKKPYLMIGILIAASTLTRPNTFLASVFFLLLLLNKPFSIKKIINLTGPIFLSLLILATYNYARFGTVFETGYKYQISTKEFKKRLDDGLFSLKVIPTNLYYMLIKSPDPILDSSNILKFPFIKYDAYGMSLFILSPALFFIFRSNFKDEIVKVATTTILIMSIPIITYTGIGVDQIGYRYALDFFPFLLIPLVSGAKKVNYLILKLLIAASCLITWFFIAERLTIFNF